jgi:hypothetical protein
LKRKQQHIYDQFLPQKNSSVAEEGNGFLPFFSKVFQVSEPKS